MSPLNPGELLIALHNIDSVKCDMKSIIKGEALPLPLAWPGHCGQNLSYPRACAGICQVGHGVTRSPISELQARFPALIPLPLSLLPAFLPVRNGWTYCALAQSSPQERWGAPPAPALAQRMKDAEPTAQLGQRHSGQSRCAPGQFLDQEEMPGPVWLQLRQENVASRAGGLVTNWLAQRNEQLVYQALTLRQALLRPHRPVCPSRPPAACEDADFLLWMRTWRVQRG